MARTAGRMGRPYRRRRAIFRERCKRAALPCAICGGKEGQIDYRPGADRTPLGFQLDHIVPWSMLPPNDPMRWNEQNWQPAHAVCNQRKNARLTVNDEPSVKTVDRPSGW